MEWILLSCFIFVTVLNLDFYINDTFKRWLISFLIIFPFILFIYFIIQYQRSKSKMNINIPSNIFKQKNEIFNCMDDALLFK